MKQYRAYTKRTCAEDLTFMLMKTHQTLILNLACTSSSGLVQS